jgi:hypothetical protein
MVSRTALYFLTRIVFVRAAREELRGMATDAFYANMVSLVIGFNSYLLFESFDA